MLTEPNEPECSNTLIYGHHIQTNTMFAELTKYESQDFADEYNSIGIDRIYDNGSYKEFKYEVIGAFLTEVNTSNNHEFSYYDYTDLTDPKLYSEY